MSIFIDTDVRNTLASHLFTIGTANGATIASQELDTSSLPFVAGSQDIYISEGENTGGSLPQDRTWLEHFLVKAPQTNITRANQCGLLRKQYQYTVWIKSLKESGTYTNEAIAGMVELHFPDNLHLSLPNGNTLTILKTYQQATVTQDSNSGRLFNRVFVDCEVYYKNN